MKVPRLKYVCLSDLHLGEEESLLTNIRRGDHLANPEYPSPVMERFREALEWILQDSEDFSSSQPTLIILGDGLDLGLSQENQALMVWERFLETFFLKDSRPLFNSIIYVPGNHDHHLWETAREIQYAEFVKRHSEQKKIPIPWHRTRAYLEEDDEKALTSPLLQSGVERVFKRKNLEVNIKVHLRYPNFIDYIPEKKRFLVFHHGHFFEKLYYLISYLKGIIFPEASKVFPPERVDDIEAENFAWIDFFWSTLGRSGEAGERVDTIWEMLQSEKGKAKLIGNLAKGIAENFDLPLIPGDYLEEKNLKIFLKGLCQIISEKLEKYLDGELSADFSKFLKHYISKAVFRQIKEDFGVAEEGLKDSELILIFGHTHKPLGILEKIEPYRQRVKLYNTGGWVADQPKLNPIYGGMPVFIDEEGNTVGLKLFSLGKEHRPEVIEPQSPEEKPSDLYRHLTERVEKNLKLWKEFTETIQRAAEIRAAHLRSKL